jgi:hypothetical protein
VPKFILIAVEQQYRANKKLALISFPSQLEDFV